MNETQTSRNEQIFTRKILRCDECGKIFYFLGDLVNCFYPDKHGKLTTGWTNCHACGARVHSCENILAIVPDSESVTYDISES